MEILCFAFMQGEQTDMHKGRATEIPRCGLMHTVQYALTHQYKHQREASHQNTTEKKEHTHTHKHAHKKTKFFRCCMETSLTQCGLHNVQAVSASGCTTGIGRFYLILLPNKRCKNRVFWQKPEIVEVNLELND